MTIIKYFLPLSEYYPTNYIKKRICIHHTMGYGGKGSIDWWKQDTARVGTAYVIDRDGIIYQAFNDQHYAYQFGLSNVSRRLEFEQSTIGIELANLGPLTKLQNGTFADQYGKQYKGSVTTKKWRGFEYWEDYTDAQYEALNTLLGMLAIKHDIDLKPCNHLNFDLSVFDKFTVMTHANCRKDKTDVSPAFDWQRINPELPI
jgi:N-acetyl-anhydromuramyl-L-alanine amidase AmpD